MAKQDLINGGNKNRSTWPPEARVCEKLWILTRKLRESNLMTDYLDGKITDDEVDILLREHDNSNIIQDIIELKLDCSIMLPDVQTTGMIPIDSKYFKTLSKLGTLLAKDCQWWERYQVITQTMGAECILSIRTAESLFKKDRLAPEIKSILTELIMEEI